MTLLLLLMVFLTGPPVQEGLAQFTRQSGFNLRLDSDEFDNDDLFDSRSRERNSFELNSIEIDVRGNNFRPQFSVDSPEDFIGNFAFNNNNLRTSNRNLGSQNRPFSISIENDSPEDFRPGTLTTGTANFRANNILRQNSNAFGNSRRNFPLRVSIEDDSPEDFRPSLRGSVANNFNTNNIGTNRNNFRLRNSLDRDSPEDFRRGFVNRNNFRNNNNPFITRVSIENDSPEDFRIFGTNTNRFRSQNNRITNTIRGNSIEVDSFGRVTIDRDSDEVINFPRNNRLPQTNNQARPQTTSNFFRINSGRDSDERRNSAGNVRLGSLELRNINRNRNANNIVFDDSVEIVNTGRNRNNVFGRDDSIEVSVSNFGRNPFIRDRSIEITRFGNNRNNFVVDRDSIEIGGFRPSFPPGRASVSTTIDSPEDLLNDLFDDDADDRARARLALDRLRGTAQGRPLQQFGGSSRPATQFPAPPPVAQTNRNPFTGFSSASRNPFPTSNFGRPLSATQNAAGGTRVSTSSSPGRPLHSTNGAPARFPPLPASPFRPSTTGNTNAISNNNVNNNNRPSNSLVSDHFSLSRPQPSVPSSINALSIPTPPRVNAIRPPVFPSTVRPLIPNRNTNPRPIVTTPRPIVTTPRTPRPIVTFPRTPRPIVTTPRPFVTTPRTPRPIVTTPRTPRPIVTTSRTPRPIVTTPRPVTSSRTSSNINRVSSFNSNAFNPFTTAARLNNAIQSSSKKPSSNPFIKGNNNNRSSSSSKIRSDNGSKLNSVGGFARNNKPSTRKSIPAIVPMGFEWPGGNGYFFRMSTGNSKPIEYFISYDN